MLTFEQIQKVRAVIRTVSPGEKCGTSGWLDRDGVFYPCEYAGHATLAEEIAEAASIAGRDAQQELEARGWLKISAGRCYFFSYKARERKWLEFTMPSKAQDDFVMMFLSERGDLTQLAEWLEARDRD